MLINHPSGNYQIEVSENLVYDSDSVDNVNRYDEIYLDKHSTTIFGMRVLQGDWKIKSAIVGSGRGPSVLHDTAIIIEDNRLLICCSNSVFCLLIPSLSLMWRTEADEATCFQIFKHEDRYIIHGELAISMIDKDGHILWQQHGGDIFTTLDGQDVFVITGEHILATDWQNRKYKFDFNGNIIE